MKSGSFLRGGAEASPEVHPQEVRARTVAAAPARAKIWMSFFIVTIDRLRRAEHSGEAPFFSRQKSSPGPQIRDPGPDGKHLPTSPE